MHTTIATQRSGRTERWPAARLTPPFQPPITTLRARLINGGSALVDVSPLSTIGALCVAAVSDQVKARDLFRKLLAWGLSMCVVGAILCRLFAGPLARL